MNGDVLFIERLEIDGFWGKYKVNIPFYSDVSILTGNNGSGKTTILDIMVFLLTNGENAVHVRSRFASATLCLSRNSSISVCCGEGKVDDTWKYSYEGMEVDYDTIREFLNVSSVCSFDTPLHGLDYISKLRAENPSVKSDVDVSLNMWFNYYYQYVASVSRVIKQSVKVGISSEQLQNLYSDLNKMEELCNEYFEHKKLWHLTDDGKIEFLLSDSSKTIKPESLSSGEKQILILLISTLILHGKRSVVLWDEPEISLHVAWQQKLIRTIRTLNPSMQLIIATHAPNILYEGWESQVIKLRKVFHE